MSDQYTEVVTRGWGSRIIDSLKGMIIGLIMFVVSFGVLYWNEGRVDLSKVAETAIHIEATGQASAEAAGQLVSTTGKMMSEGKVGDRYLQEGDYIAVERVAEMFAWVEHSETKTERHAGGSETSKTTYTYTKEWVKDPRDSASFKKPEGHSNPAKLIDSRLVKAQSAKLGDYDLDLGQLTLPNYKQISLSENNVIIEDELKLVGESYLFKGAGSLGDPQVGDIRVSYEVVHNPIENATVFGKLNSSRIDPFYGPKNAKLYRAFEGSRDYAISTLATEHQILTWILRGVGFMLMWFGLMALLKPISIFLDVLPFLGSVSRAGVGLVTFLVALVLSVVTIIVSMIVHSVTALIVVLVVFIIGMVVFLKHKGKKHAQTAQTTPEPVQQTVAPTPTEPQAPIAPQTPQTPQVPPQTPPTEPPTPPTGPAQPQ